MSSMAPHTKSHSTTTQYRHNTASYAGYESTENIEPATRRCDLDSRELKIETFSGRRQLQPDVTSHLLDIAHAPGHHLAVVVPSAT